MMNERTDCNKCGKEFILDEFRFGVIKQGDLIVRYFSCPFCGERYHVFTSDSEMRALIEKRKTVQLKIKEAFAKKFREKTIKRYERELDRIKKAQNNMMPELKCAGEKILQESMAADQ